jgi:mRNA-degrading endonuclease RelE of RelBE toxin-antitoxin system
MSWDVYQTRRFARAYKKLHDNVAAKVDEAVTEIAENPDVGQKKKGDLSDLWVHKFRDQGQLYLLGYTRDDSVRLVYLEAVGPNENLYRSSKRCAGFSERFHN